MARTVSVTAPQQLRHKASFLLHLADTLPSMDDTGLHHHRETAKELSRLAGELDYLLEEIEHFEFQNSDLIAEAQKDDNYDDAHEGWCAGMSAARNSY